MKKNFLYFMLTISILTACTSDFLRNATQVSPTKISNETLAVSSTAISPSTETFHLSNSKGCIPPLVVSGYQQGEGVSTPLPVSDVIPLDWHKVSEIPEKFKDRIAYVSLIRSRIGHDELWVGVHNRDEFTNTNDIFLVFQTDTQEWREVSFIPGFNLFVGKDQSIWVYTYSTSDTEPKFYRLDESDKQFVPVMDRTNELGAGHITSNIRVDRDGVFWFIFRNADDATASNESLYSFNPQTQEARHIISGLVLAEDLEIDGRDNLYILQKDGTLVYYQPSSNESRKVDLPPDSKLGIGGNLYLDHQNRLWVSDRLWFDLAKDSFARPYVLIRSPIFIDYVDYLGRYEWMRPSVILESIDGRLWFNSTRGTAWFRPDSGEWCLFTTYGSNIVEDSEHNLWMLIGNGLYKYRVEQ